MRRVDDRVVSASYVVGRRHALAGLGAATMGATALMVAACNGDASPKVDRITSTAGPVDTAAAAPVRRGGVLKARIAYDVDTLDPIIGKGAPVRTIAPYVYSLPLKFKVGKGAFSDGSIEPNAFAKWEQPDPTTLIMRLRDGMKLDQRPPTSGRVLTIEDVVLSWQNFASQSVYKGDLSNAASKDAPIVSLRSVDGNTIEITTAFPDAQLLASLAFVNGVWILPKEAFNGGFDPATTTRGTGPWTLEKYQPSVGFSFRKNPNYYVAAQYPLMDGVELAIITAAAQAEAQFKAKNVLWGDFNSELVPQVEVLDFHKDLKDTRIDLAAAPIQGSSVSFGWREGSPFRDVRVRQAISMLLDRDVFIEVFNDLKTFQAASVPMKGYWSSPLPGGFGPYWLDPKGDRFGPSAKYFRHDVAEAKKLLTAAGYAAGFETPFTFVSGTQYGVDWGQRAEALISMLAQGGIRAKANPVDYTSVWVPQYLRSNTDFLGLAMYPNGQRSEPGQWLQGFLASSGANNQVGKNFPEIDALIAAQRREFDTAKRISVIHDVQRACAEGMPIAPQGGTTETPSLSWNGFHGPDEYIIWPGNTGPGGDLLPYCSLDDTLRG